MELNNFLTMSSGIGHVSSPGNPKANGFSRSSDIKEAFADFKTAMAEAQDELHHIMSLLVRMDPSLAAMAESSIVENNKGNSDATIPECIPSLQSAASSAVSIPVEQSLDDFPVHDCESDSSNQNFEVSQISFPSGKIDGYLTSGVTLIPPSVLLPHGDSGIGDFLLDFTSGDFAYFVFDNGAEFKQFDPGITTF